SNEAETGDETHRPRPEPAAHRGGAVRRAQRESRSRAAWREPARVEWLAGQAARIVERRTLHPFRWRDGADAKNAVVASADPGHAGPGACRHPGEFRLLARPRP